MTEMRSELRDGIMTVTMDDGENLIGTKGLRAWDAMLDQAAERSVDALVVVGTDRYWSTGLDLDEVVDMTDNGLRTFMRGFDLLLGKLLTAPFLTIAAMNGHTYAGGALLALAHDYRIMRDDRGFFCLPSVEVGIAFSPGMSSLIAAKLPQPIAHDLVVSCRRIGGREAEAAGVVHRAVPAHAVLDVAVEYGHAFGGKDPETLASVKRRLYPEATSMLTVER